MLKLILKILLFASGVVVLVILSTLPPEDTFTFRNWEAMLWGLGPMRPTVGIFYPNKYSIRNESGDLGHNSTYNSIKQNIVWKTDKYGFRNNPETTTGYYDIVLVGDSMSVGCGTTQDQILSNQISRKINSQVFNYSQLTIDDDFLNNLTDMKINPKIIIYQVIERNIPRLDNININNRRTFKNKIISQYRIFFAKYKLMYIPTAVSRFYKKEPINYIKGKLDSILGDLDPTVISGAENVLFYKGSLSTKQLTHETVISIGNKLENLSSSFRKRGIEFIFLPVPDKESIYLELIPDNLSRLKRNNVLTDIKSELDKRGVRSVDTISPFRYSFHAGKRIYHPDDTHWNETGIEIAAGLIAKEIKITPITTGRIH